MRPLTGWPALFLSRRDRPERGPLLALAALVLLLFGDVVFRGRVFFERDILLLWYSQAQAFVRVVAAGSWPVWNPFDSFGRPLLANPNTQVLYPPTWLTLLLPPESYYTVYVVGHFLLTGVGFHLLARRLGISRLGSFVGSAAWLLCGPLLSTVQLWNHLAGAAWLPWVLLAADTAFSSGRREHSLLWGLTMAAQVFVGSPESLLMGGLLALGLGLRHLSPSTPWGGQARRLSAVAGLAFGFGLALSAAQWIPTLAASAETPRLGLPAPLRSFWSIHPVQALEIGLPLELDRLPLPPGLRADLFESREAFLPSLYAGLTAVALAGAALSSRRRGPLLLLTVAGMAVLLALGRHTPLYGFTVSLLPVLRAFRYPAKAMIAMSLALALLTGMGLDACRQARLARRWWLLCAGLPLAAATLACAVAALFACGVLPSHPSPILGGGSLAELLSPATERLTVAALLGGVTLVLQARATSGRARPWDAAALVIAVILDLLTAHRGLNRTAPRELYSLRPAALDFVRASDRSRLYVFDYHLPGRSQRYLGHDGGFVLADGPPLPWRAAAAMQTYLHPSTVASFGLEGSFVADVMGLHPPFLDRLTRALFEAEESPTELRLLQAGAVGHVIALHTRGFEDLIPVATRGSLFLEPIRVFRVPQPLPRSYAVGTVRVADDMAAEKLLLSPAPDLRREALVATGRALQAPPGFSGSSAIEALQPDRVRIRAEANGPALVVLVDTYDPGWTVTVDGSPASARRVNLAFRGVEVPAGVHRIEWVYRPASLSLGFLLSGLAVAGAFGLGLAGWRRRRGRLQRST